MKRTIATILFVLYLVSSSGATISFHYCMGKFIGADLATNDNSKCSNCGMAKENKKGCCNDNRKILQLKKDQLSTTENQLTASKVQHLNNQYYSPIPTLALLNIDDFGNADRPPGNLTRQLFILNCVFRI